MSKPSKSKGRKGASTPEEQIKGKAVASAPNTPNTPDPDLLSDGNDSLYSDSDSSSVSSTSSGRSRVAHGVLADGTHFAVPETESVLHALFSPAAWATPFQWLWVGSIILTCSTLWFAKTLPGWFFIAQCMFWRMGYNFGLGFILHNQSKTRWWEKVCKRYVFSSPVMVRLLERCVLFVDPTVKRFALKDYPSEFSSWLAYRFVVKVVLALDVSAYSVLVLVHWIWPTVDGTWDTPWLALGEVSATLWLRYTAFIVLFVFALWSKSDAHRVLGDYAWYWGDFWFLLEKDLVFDGIFQMFPHPMYTVGYSFIYGCSLASSGFTVFFCSVASHLLQMFFLAFVENPHIDKTYNVMTAPTPIEQERDRLLYGETSVTKNKHGNQVYELPYFERNELIYLRNFDWKRSFDWILLSFVLYSSLTGLLMGTWANDMTTYSGWGPISGGLLFSVLQAVIWRILGTFVIGYILRRQSTENWWVDMHQGNTHLAFQHWKTLYNTVNTMGIVSYVVVILRCFIQYFHSPPEAVVDGTNNSVLIQLLETVVDLTDPSSRYAVVVIGILLCLINLYVSDGVFDAIGPYGYFYSDFFIKNVPTSTLTYNGIYRYLNNPDTNLGFAGYYGLVLCCPKHTFWVCLPLAIFAHLCAKFFQVWVEEPHMKRHYSREQLRKEGGLRSEIKRRARGMRAAMKSKKDDVEASIAKLQKELKEKTQQRDEIKSTLKKTKDQTAPVGGAASKGKPATTKAKKEQ